MRILYNDVDELVLPMGKNGEHCPGKTTQDKDGEGGHKEEEIFVVPASNAVVHPRAVVVKILHRGKREIREVG